MCIRRKKGIYFLIPRGYYPSLYSFGGFHIKSVSELIYEMSIDKLGNESRSKNIPVLVVVLPT